jgi:hypothetical protein
MRNKKIRISDPNNRTGVRDLIFNFRRYLDLEKKKLEFLIRDA